MRKIRLALLLAFFLFPTSTTLSAIEYTERLASVKAEREELGFSRENIMKVQEVLKSEGFYAGRVDGIIGPLTRSALEAYQRRHNLPVTGRIDEPTTRAMNLNIDIGRRELREEERFRTEREVGAPGVEESEAVKAEREELGFSRENIMKAQEVLKSEGLYAGPVDGVLGPVTRSAIETYQRRHNLPVTGRIDEPTARAMNLRIP